MLRLEAQGYREGTFNLCLYKCVTLKRKRLKGRNLKFVFKSSNSWLTPSVVSLPDIRPPFNRLLRMWGNSKFPSLRNEMSTYFILSPQGTKPTIHSPVVEERPVQKTLKTKCRSFNHIPGD
ncbi:hypothetical protein AVEN_122352-1 [Araneus ventricosus]|uniref:Uncharacterized protein n=1 Tax=Araneus ventricosus TaxID=182803 RepID=A0A4Y2ND14_ARAVE|nr:hypothetical protein AVEN_122352-1 [Araneus ventricosus]